MSTPVLRYAPPWLVDVASLNADRLGRRYQSLPPGSSVVAPDETPKGVPKKRRLGGAARGGGGGGGGDGLSFLVSANQLRLPTERWSRPSRA
jgi:hypothetical protein